MAENDRQREGQSQGGGQAVSKTADILRRLNELAADRAYYESIWKEIAIFFLPMQSRFQLGSLGTASMMDRVVSMTPQARTGSRRRYDSTPISALDRLASGMESMITPQAETWHDLVLEGNSFAPASMAQQQWLDAYRDNLFSIRYSPASGFVSSNQKAIRSACAFAVGVMFVEDGFSSAVHTQGQVPLILYQHVPLSQIYIGVNAQGRPDTAFRRLDRTPRQLAQKFGKEALSKKMQGYLEDSRMIDKPQPIVHAVYPRLFSGIEGTTLGVKSGGFESAWIELDQKHEIANGGYFEFPFIVYYWLQGDATAYGDSPAMIALDDVRGLNVMKKVSLQAAQQHVMPPLATASDGVIRPNLNPGMINPGGLDANGNLKIKPITVTEDPGRIAAFLETERENVRRLLHNDLFAILMQNPQMTATEALQRAGEKADLLGPQGAQMSMSMSYMVEREAGILSRQGIYDPDSGLAPPESMAGRSFSFRSSTPLDRMRESKQLVAMQQVFATAMQFGEMQAKAPEMADNFDGDEIARIAVRKTGAPSTMLKSDERKAEERDARAQQQEAAQGMEALKTGAGALKDGLPAMQGLAAMQGGEPPMEAVE